MKKTFLLGTILFLTLASCCKKNSSHCIVKDNSGNTVKDYGVKNGTAKDIKNYENSCMSDAAQYNGTVSCNDGMM